MQTQTTKSNDSQSNRNVPIPSLQETPLKDATIHGELDADSLNRKISISTGKRARAKSFSTTTSSLERFFALLSDHKVGKKDGLCFIPGAFFGNKRSSAQMKSLDFVVLDVDSGQPIGSVLKRLKKLNLLSAVYTTHSNGKDQSDIGRDQVLKYFTLSETETVTPKMVCEFLIEERGYHSSVMTTCEILNDGTGITGVMVIKHDPMAKFRVVLPMLESFSFPKDKSVRRTVNNRWKAFYGAVAELVGVNYDKSCSDVARLFYFPRHAEGADFSVDIVAGDLLDLSTISITSDGVETANVKSKSVENLNNHWLQKFAAKYAKDFEAADFFEEYGERAKQNGNMVVGQCPNDHAHSNPGDETDTAFFACNASTSDAGSFVFGCHHNGCSDMDRLDMLDLIVDEFDLAESDLMEFVSIGSNSNASSLPAPQEPNYPDMDTKHKRPPNKADWSWDEWLDYFNAHYAVVAQNGQTYVVSIRPKDPLVSIQWRLSKAFTKTPECLIKRTSG